MNIKVLPVAMLSVALATSAVRAQPPGKFFAVASIGHSDTRYSPTFDDWIADGDRTFELGIGYAFSRHFSIQGSYHDFGQTVGVSGCPPESICLVPPGIVDVDIDGWSVTLAGSLPLGERFAVFGKAGVIAWDASAGIISRDTVVFIEGPISGGVLISFGEPLIFGEDLNGSGADPIYGAGLRWLVSTRWSVELSYEEVNLDLRSGKLGATFRF